MEKRRSKIIACAALIMFALILPLSLCACSEKSWQKKFDTTLPSLKSEDGWSQTMNDDFSKFSNIEDVYANTSWKPSPHGLRNMEYWCDQMITYDSAEGAVVIKSLRTDSHSCEVCKKSEGIFTGGIETADYDGDTRKPTFAQAYGYFEAEVKVPTAQGMWSAFWLQSYSVGKIGNSGKDGTEIDVYESSFHKNPTKTGNALHWDAYNAPYYKMADHVTDTGKNLYDGQYHKYSVLWTPDRYVFYVDGQAVWATDKGGVSTVGEYLRLTVEIRDGKIGPYGQSLGKFENADDGSTDFCIKKVGVWQNDEFKEHIQNDENFSDMKNTFDRAIGATIAIGVIAVVAVILLIVLVCKRVKTDKKGKKA